MTRSRGGITLATALAALWLAAGPSGQAPSPSTARGEWPHYTADLRGTKVLAARSDRPPAISISSKSRGG